MNRSLKESRMAFIAAGVLALVFTGKLLVLPLIEKGRSMEASIQTKTALLNRLKEDVLRKPGLEIKRKALKEEINRLEALLVDGKTSTLALAQLQSNLEKTSKRNGAGIQRVRTFKPEDKGDYTGISVQLTLTSDIRSLLNLLFDIENAAKAFSISQMDVHFQDRQNRPQIRTILKVEAGMKNDQDAVSLVEEGRKVEHKKGVKEG